MPPASLARARRECRCAAHNRLARRSPTARFSGLSSGSAPCHVFDFAEAAPIPWISRSSPLLTSRTSSFHSACDSRTVLPSSPIVTPWSVISTSGQAAQAGQSMTFFGFHGTSLNSYQAFEEFRFYLPDRMSEGVEIDTRDRVLNSRFSPLDRASVLVPTAGPQHDPHHGEHDRHLDQHADDGRQRGA